MTALPPSFHRGQLLGRVPDFGRHPLREPHRHELVRARFRVLLANGVETRWPDLVCETHQRRPQAPVTRLS